jgi:hypothetical protein
MKQTPDTGVSWCPGGEAAKQKSPPRHKVVVKSLRHARDKAMKTKRQEPSLQLNAVEQAALQAQWQGLAASYGAEAQVVQTI